MIVPDEFPIMPEDQRGSWPSSGPWSHEPNFESWVDPATGYCCAILRGPLGHLCGYVRVPQGHPAFGTDYDDLDVEVHGSLTYGDPKGWFGFDCAHSGDLCPGSRFLGGIYRPWEYVKGQVTSLASQLKAQEPTWLSRVRDAQAAIEVALEGLAEAEKRLKASSADEYFWLGVIQRAHEELKEVQGSLAANLPSEPTQ